MLIRKKRKEETKPRNYNKYKYNSIYSIRNTVTNKIYIGRSVRPESRVKQHFSYLRSGKGYKEMQKDFDVYGESSFDYQILETHLIKDADPREREDFYINKFDTLNNGYNSSPGIRKGSFSMSTNVTEEMYKLIKRISSNENRTASSWIKEAVVEKLERIDQ